VAICVWHGALFVPTREKAVDHASAIDGGQSLALRRQSAGKGRAGQRAEQKLSTIRKLRERSGAFLKSCALGRSFWTAFPRNNYTRNPARRSA
jgi:hypothetical protein